MNDLEIPFITFSNLNLSGFIHLFKEKNNQYLLFIPFTSLNENLLISFSHFSFTFYIPTKLLEEIKEKPTFKYNINEYQLCSPNIIENSLKFFKENKEKEIEFKFYSSFYFVAFLSQLLFFNSLEFLNENNYLIIEKRNQLKKIIINNKKNILLNNSHDLVAHQSLLDFLGFINENLLKSFNDNLILNLINNSNDLNILNELSKSKIPLEYCSILFLILLLNNKENNNFKYFKNNINNNNNNFQKKINLGIEIEKPIIEYKYKNLYIIDNLFIGGSTNIGLDYESLKLQWNTITNTQFSNMNNLRISFKLLENSLLTSYPLGHPLINVIFNVMASFFVMKDEFESYLSEIFYIITSISELFYSTELSFDINFSEGEHLIFWLFYSLINKTQIINFFHQRNPENILSKTLHIIIMIHPLLYSLLEKEGINNLRFPSNVLFSLFSKVFTPIKLYPIWIMALSNKDPMLFFQYLMATSLILIYPKIIEKINIIEQIEKELKKLFDEENIDILLSNTLKLIEATQRN